MCSSDLPQQHVFTMMRSKAAIRNLQLLETRGVIAVNSAFGIENCTREKMTTLLLENRIPHPDSLILNTQERISELNFPDGFEPCWAKRADFHAIHREDVTYVRTIDELRNVIAEYALRGIDRVVVNKHLKGDLVKFYGVAGTDFFYWFYPQEGSHSKFGLEAINGMPSGIPFSVDDLREICNMASKVLNVHVYGGYCIFSPEGDINSEELRVG